MFPHQLVNQVRVGPCLVVLQADDLVGQDYHVAGDQSHLLQQAAVPGQQGNGGAARGAWRRRRAWAAAVR